MKLVLIWCHWTYVCHLWEKSTHSMRQTVICFTLMREQNLAGVEDFIFYFWNKNSIRFCIPSRTISTREGGGRRGDPLDVPPGAWLGCSPGGHLDRDQYHSWLEYLKPKEQATSAGSCHNCSKTPSNSLHWVCSVYPMNGDEDSVLDPFINLL